VWVRTLERPSARVRPHVDFKVSLAAILLVAALDAAPVLGRRLVHLLMFLQTARIPEKLSARLEGTGQKVFLAPAVLLFVVFQVGLVLERLVAARVHAMEITNIQLTHIHTVKHQTREESPFNF